MILVGDGSSVRYAKFNGGASQPLVAEGDEDIARTRGEFRRMAKVRR
jgi:hypothetical protein